MNTKLFDVWYMRPEFFREGIMGAAPNHLNLVKTHRWLKTISAVDMDDVYFQMQGENWSPNGEARALIRSKGLEHTSMSVGDVIVTHGTETAFLVARVGFTELGKLRGLEPSGRAA